MTPSQSIADLGEHGLIARLRMRVPAPPSWVTLGIGDDAAAIAPEPGEQIVLTTDSVIEGVHFDRALTPMDAVGHKALAVNLSDLAAMGAEPRGVLLGLSLPATLPLADFDGLLEGFLALAARTKTPLIGGNITRSPGPIAMDVTAVGSARARRLVTRAGGRPGDALYVTGSVGAAAAGLGILRAGIPREAIGTDLAACVARHERPEPRLRAGLIASRSRAVNAGIDLSDGLADGVRQLADASQTGVVIDADAVPVDAGARAWASRQGLDPLDAALAGGEDYELLFAVPRRRTRAFLGAAGRWGGLAVTRIGHLTKEPGAWLERGGRREPLPAGFVHF